jgi:hypothetical protein
MSVTNKHAIKAFMHCGLCVEEVKRSGASPRDHAQLEVGWTEQDLQVWCRRYDCNVVHIDFQGRKMPANTTRESAKPH